MSDEVFEFVKKALAQSDFKDMADEIYPIVEKAIKEDTEKRELATQLNLLTKAVISLDGRMKAIEMQKGEEDIVPESEASGQTGFGGADAVDIEAIEDLIAEIAEKEGVTEGELVEKVEENVAPKTEAVSEDKSAASTADPITKPDVEASAEVKPPIEEAVSNKAEANAFNKGKKIGAVEAEMQSIEKSDVQTPRPGATPDVERAKMEPLFKAKDEDLLNMSFKNIEKKLRGMS